MTREDIRRENARALAHSVGGPTDFGRMLEMDASQVSQIIGKNPKKNIGNSIAKRIETAFSKPGGWLDVAHQKGSDMDSESRAAAPDQVRYSLDLEQLVYIKAIDEREAAILRRYRIANDVGVSMIESAADNAPKKILATVIDHKPKDRPSGTGDGHSL
ncbi:hypothetical protein [Rugamonas aquatica]|uniref:XRE family transcriptional regulator n=1 Tax=Rugamonas aquatica TaxID=2743357 RepID=A0A6A7N256_9BURK|nr:hypothetical protein [Rugamonas aquatica]MQA39010.1 hypothetical protein [Rugamonas aquatica]